MAHKEPKISKQTATDITRHITLKIPETLEINRKPGNATSQSIITAEYKIGLLNMHGTKKHKKILPVKT